MPGSSYMNGDMMRDDVRIGQYVTLLSVDHESGADRASLQLRLPGLGIIGSRSFYKNCTLQVSGSMT